MDYKKITTLFIFLFLFTGFALAQNETTTDPCAGVVCSPSIQKCPDGFQSTCNNGCANGVCGLCSPDCSGHDTTIQPAVTPQPVVAPQPVTTQPINTSTQTTTDKCANIICGEERIKCNDGFESICKNICDSATGGCIKCTPGCYGHEITTPICEQRIIYAVDGAGNCKEFSNSCLSPGWSAVERCPEFNKNCGNMICEIGETKENCPKDCIGSLSDCPATKSMTPDETRMCSEKGGDVTKNVDNKGCLISYECRELQKKVPVCPTISNDICTNGFLLSGGYDSNNCPLGQTCCGNNRCQTGGEGKETIENCAQDCTDIKKLNCPNVEKDKENCLVAGQRYIKQIGDNGCEKIQCQSKDAVYKQQETNLPPGCWEEIMNDRKVVRCEQTNKCSRDPKQNSGLQPCLDKGGRVEYDQSDPSDCRWKCIDDNFENQYIRKEPIQSGQDCWVGEERVPCPSLNFGTTEKQFERCPTSEETAKKQQQCREMGMDAEFVGEGQCFMPRCIPKDQKMCAEQRDPSIAERIKSQCKDAGKPWTMVPDPIQSNCKITVCGDGSENSCRKEIPSYSFEDCKNSGGEIIMEKDYDGCIVFMDCVRKGDKSKVTFSSDEMVTEVPDATKLLDIAFKLEELKMALDKLARKTDSIADYYASVKNDNEEGRYRRIADMFDATKGEVDRIRTELKNKLNSLTVDDVMKVKQDIKYIKEVTIKDIVYYMLSDEGAKELSKTTTKLNFCSADDDKKFTECEKQGGRPQSDPSKDGCEIFTGCEQGGDVFFTSFTTCQKLENFRPETDKGPVININGLEGGNCILEMSITKDAMGSDGPPEAMLALMGMSYPLKMTCKIPGDKYPLGPEAIFGQGDPDPKIIEQLCTGDLAKLMQFKPPGQQGPSQQSAKRYSQCNDGICEEDEKNTCPADCQKPVCGDGRCENYRGEDEYNCKPDCGRNDQNYVEPQETSVEVINTVESSSSSGGGMGQSVVQTTTQQACSGCLNNGVCDIGECSDCADCI
ncbi:MAG: hypothetical protein V1870_00040 [Candidatus Aenigmatarchaeota archaeon]